MELRKLVGLGTLAAGLTLWYVLNRTPSDYPSPAQRYQLPTEIQVTETTLPYKTEEKIVKIKDENGVIQERKELEKVLYTKDIDFSKHFMIKTDRYEIVKDDDGLVSRGLGHLFSLPVRLYFWNWNAHLGLDKNRSREVLSMLENDKSINNLSVRINHNKSFYDWYRMMSDEQLKKRNPFIYRLSFGSWAALKSILVAEIGRGDYYNPLTKTAVVYSNIESIIAHEIGHHKDYERFNTDWAYNLGRLLPPVTLYQEWKASSNAKGIMSKEDEWQFNRYLLPAFLTHVLATILSIKKLFKRKEEENPRYSFSQ